ncbi:MBL fold metallo-hydrolase [Salinicoccus halitifaciens]|uniref:Glyoxylase-like metal-dependent hydrolase (Beta-lactamase superfamily II) n=1 Tax=Salinicoccus halitifaciens TaxID=1073415 RepID=A0ABV2E8S0_9STAP|nr:MBL fold metallo-hydrolase [Salinicoccus halitifaciens]MCD2137938.1 MBL fold metallo-hydrolase [Salinicoccus halitifaciens]
MDKMKYGDDYKKLPVTSVNSGKGVEVLPDLYQYTVQIVNMAFYGKPESGDGDYVIIDAGMPKSSEDIIEEAEKRFGTESKPKAIILTHGHFDHVGAVIELVEHWNVPVYAHKEELPYLTGKEDYPKPDPSVDGGMVPKMAPAFPRKAIDLGDNVEALPEDGSVPHMPGFEWIHTPGHSAGHVSLFREEDGALISGDAFVTVKQDALYNVLSQKESIYGPPRYLTTDWDLAYESVKKLHDLTPKYAITGHGPPLTGKALGDQLGELVQNFDEIAKPKKGKYVDDE